MKKKLEEISMEEMEGKESKKESETKESHASLLEAKDPEKEIAMYFNPE